MKKIMLIISIIMSIGIVSLHAAEYKHSRSSKKTIEFHGVKKRRKQVFVIIMGLKNELPLMGEKFKSSQSLFEHVLKIKVQGDVKTYETMQGLRNLFANDEDNIKLRVAQGQYKLLFVAKGSEQTVELLKFIENNAQASDSLAGILGDKAQGSIHSIILLNPKISKSRGFDPVIPDYSYIYNRIYNFFTETDDSALYRHIYPAGQDQIPDENFYFKGVNLNCKKVDYGNIVAMSLKDLHSIDFNTIAKAIQEVNKFRMHATFNVLLEDEGQAFPIPLIWIRENYGVYIIDKTTPQDKSLQCYIKTVIARSNVQRASKVTQNVVGKAPVVGSLAKGMTWAAGKIASFAGAQDWNYESGVFTLNEIRDELKKQISNENCYDYETVQKFFLPESIHQTQKSENREKEQLDDYYMLLGEAGTSLKQCAPSTSRARALPCAAVKKDVRIFSPKCAEDEGLNERERRFLVDRKRIIGENLRRLGINHLGAPTIAIVASGGGSRAMFATFGVLKGLARIGLFDAVTYMCGLSGSTWAMGILYDYFVKNPTDLDSLSLINRVSNDAAKNIHEFNFIDAFLIGKAKREVTPSIIHEIPLFIRRKRDWGQPVTNTDYYGNAIAKMLFGEDRAEQGQPLLSSLYAGFQRPFPIFTAGGIPQNMKPSVWFEFTPFEVGAVLGKGDLLKGAFVPTKLFGSNFEYGVCNGSVPEQPLAFYLGVFGSALNISVKNLTQNPTIFNPDFRFANAQVLNPYFRLSEELPDDFSKNNTIGLFDAGLMFNLPYPVLNPYGNLRKSRCADIIIFIDASDDNYGHTLVRNGFESWPDGTTLREVEKYAREYQLPFPKIPAKGDEKSPGTATCQVFSEKDKPLVVYYPVARSIPELEKSDRETINQLQYDNNIEDVVEHVTNMTFNTYESKHTDLSEKEAQVLMAFMEYNVINQLNYDLLTNSLRAYRNTSAMKPGVPNYVVRIKNIMANKALIDQLNIQEVNELIHHIDQSIPPYGNLGTARVRLRRLLDAQHNMASSTLK